MAKKATATEIDPNERLDQLAKEIEASEAEMIEIEARIWNTETPTADLIRKHQATRAGIVDLYRAAGRLANDLVASTQGVVDRLEAKVAEAEAAYAEAIEKAKQILIDAGAGPDTIRTANSQRLIDHNRENALNKFAKQAERHVSVTPASEALDAAREEYYAAANENNLHKQNRETIRQRIGVEWAASIGGRR